MSTRSTSTKLYQFEDPEPGQLLWIKTKERRWVKSKIKAVPERRNVNDGEEFQMVMTEFPGYEVNITKYPEMSLRSKQETSGWTRCPTEKKQEYIELQEEDFGNANDDDGHDLNLYKDIFVKKIEDDEIVPVEKDGKAVKIKEG